MTPFRFMFFFFEMYTDDKKPRPNIPIKNSLLKNPASKTLKFSILNISLVSSLFNNNGAIITVDPFKKNKHSDMKNFFLKLNTVSSFGGKKLMIVSFLEGKAKQNLSPSNCKSIGSEIAKMHELTKNLKLKRENDLSINSWRKLFNSVKDKCENIHKDLPRLIEENLNDVEKNWPKNLPRGIIHADLFHDNIFFIQDKFSGVIDFYFSCEDFFAFEIAICFNALCFDGLKSNLSFNVTKAKNFIDGYTSVRKLSQEELDNIKVLSQGAALRFLLTRVFDALNKVEGAIVKIKDPMEYLKRLEFHKNAKNHEDYFF